MAIENVIMERHAKGTSADVEYSSSDLKVLGMNSSISDM
jgi:hypothetical protein